jgi:hypothetical protein
VEQWSPVDLPRVLVTCGQPACDTAGMNGPIGDTYLWLEVDDDRYAEPVQRQF